MGQDESATGARARDDVTSSAMTVEQMDEGEALALVDITTPVLDVLVDAAVLYTASGRIRYANPVARALFGLDTDPTYETWPVAKRLRRLAPRDTQGQALPWEQWHVTRLLRGETITSAHPVETLITGLDGREHFLSYTGAPIRDGEGRVLGAIAIGRDLTEQRQLEAERQAALLREQEARQAAEHATYELHSVEAVTEAALAHLSLDALLPELLRRVRSVMRTDNAAMLLVEPDGQTLTVLAANGVEEADVAGVRVPVGQGFAGRIAASGAPLVVEDLKQFDAVGVTLRERLRSVAGVPLIVEGRVLGVLHVGTLEPRHFTTQDIHLLQLVADRIALAIDHARLYDVAEVARAEAERQAHELEATFEAMADGVAICDEAGRVVRANAAFDALLAVQTHTQPFTLTPADRNALLQPRDAQGQPLPPEQQPIPRILAGETLSEANIADLRFRTLDGREVDVSVTGAPLRDGAGKIAGAVAVFRDVTDRRHLERRTRETLDALLTLAETLVDVPNPPSDEAPGEAPGEAEAFAEPERHAIAQRIAVLTREVLDCHRVGIIAIEPETQIQRPVALVGLAPEQARQWWAEQQQQEVRFGEGADPELIARFVAGETLVLDMREPPFNQLPNPYGITTSLFAPMRVGDTLVGLLSLDFGGPPHVFTAEETALAAAVAKLGALAIERDRLIHEREAAHAQTLALQEINHRKDEFLSIAGHELRTPLTSFKANMQLALRRLNTLQAQGDGEPISGAQLAPLRTLVDRSRRQAERMERLINDLLEATRLATDQFTLQVAESDLVTVVRDAVEEQRQVWPKREIRLTLPQQPRVVVAADGERIGQVVTNYLTNALKYAPPEKPITATLEVTEDALRVSVRDEGPGLPAEELTRIWERFHKVEGIEQWSGSGLGLGLGLHISKAIIERHGGAVGVESAPGEGSTFWFTLPLMPSGEEAS